MKRFVSSVQHITGQRLEVVTEDQLAASDITAELESLRSKVDVLNNEVRTLDVYCIVC
jgi:hypothetical protein